MWRPVLGLRGQLLLTLGAVFLLSTGLLLVTTHKLAQRQEQLTLGAQQRQWAAWLQGLQSQASLPSQNRHAPQLAAQAPRPTQPAARGAAGGASADGSTLSGRNAIEQALRQLHRQGIVRGAQLGQAPNLLRIGDGKHNPTLSGELDGGLHFALWLAPHAVPKSPALARLLAFYLTITFASALVLAYGLLTRTLVRPLGTATVQAERLSQGQLQQRLPLQGAAEVVRLSRAFNTMANALEQEQALLRSRVHELEAKTKELREAQQQVVHGEKLASVGRLSAGIAHEIGNPLAAILGLLELLREGDLPAETQREFLNRVVNETERIHHIIGGLLDFARKEPAATPRTEVALEPLVTGALTLVRSQRAARGVVFTLELSLDALVVRARETALSQVVLNLLLNALDAVDGQGEIAIRSRRLGDRIELSVEDNGTGLCPKIAQQMFEPFVTTKPPGQGTGLGLAVSAALCAQMGGSLQGNNRSEGGACFRIDLERA